MASGGVDAPIQQEGVLCYYTTSSAHGARMHFCCHCEEDSLLDCEFCMPCTDEGREPRHCYSSCDHLECEAFGVMEAEDAEADEARVAASAELRVLLLVFAFISSTSNTLHTYQERLEVERLALVASNAAGDPGGLWCGYCGTRVLPLYRCTRCRLVRYCNHACQRADRKNHAAICDV